MIAITIRHVFRFRIRYGRALDTKSGVFFFVLSANTAFSKPKLTPPSRSFFETSRQVCPIRNEFRGGAAILPLSPTFWRTSRGSILNTDVCTPGKRYETGL